MQLHVIQSSLLGTPKFSNVQTKSRKFIFDCNFFIDDILLQNAYYPLALLWSIYILPNTKMPY